MVFDVAKTTSQHQIKLDLTTISTISRIVTAPENRNYNYILNRVTQQRSWQHNSTIFYVVET